jgi:hypothetical protein
MKKTLVLTALALVMLTTLKAQNVGIGTTSPLNQLHVKQSIPNRAIEWEHENQIDYWTVGIGTNTLNCRFEFNGTLRGSISSIDGAFLTGSDFRLKEDIELLPQLLPKILKLKAYKYFFKDTHHLAKYKSLGFIAQDMESIFPELVYDMDGGLKGINYSAFGVLAIKAIQEQEQNTVQQQKIIIEQQNKISGLEDRLLKLEIAFTNLNK